MVLRSRVCLEEAAHVDREVARTLTARRTNDVASHVDTSQNVHSGNASGNRTHDVGLEAITHGERVARADEFARTTVDAGLRLAASGRTLARRMLDRAHERAIAQRLTALDGKRRVEVGRVECRATLDSECALREKRPIHLLVEALHDSCRLIVRALDEDESALFQGQAQASAADHEDLGTFRKLLGHDRGDIHRGRHDHVSGSLKVHAVELVGDLCGRTHRIVGDERRGHAKSARLNDGGSRVLDALVPRPGGAVKVKQRAVIVLSQSVAGAAQRRPLAVDIRVLVQRHVDNLSVFGNDGHSSDDLSSLVIATELGETLGLDLHQATTQLVVHRRGQRSESIVNNHEAHVGLSEVCTGAGGDEHKLDLLGEIKGRGIGSVDNLNGLLGVAEASFGIGLNRTQGGIAAHTAHSAHLAQRFLVASGCVSSQRSGLTHDVDASGAGNCGLCVLVRSFGIKIDQLARHHEVPSNNVVIGARQSRERAQCIAIQFIGADAGGNRRLIAVRRDVLVRRGVGLVRSVLPAVVTEVASAIIALLEPTAAIVTTLITATIPTTIIATTEITAIIIATLEVATLTIATVITETTTTIIITTLEVTSAIIALLEPTASVITALIAAAIPTTIIASAEITAIVIATLEVATLTIATVIAETTATIIITTLEVTSAIIALLEPTATAVLKTTASVITTLITATIPTTIIAATKITAFIITTLEVTTLTIATVIAEATTTIIITTLEVASAIITLLEAAATAVLEPTASVITTLITATIPTTIIATAEITAIIIATLEVTTIPIAETTTTIIITTLEVATLTAVGTFAVTVTPLRLALLVSTTAKFAASSSLFCHGVYPLFLRRLAFLSAVRNARSTTQY